MSTLIKSFSFAATGLPYTAEGGSWAGNVGGGTGITVLIDSRADSPNDTSATVAELEINRAGKNLIDGAPYFEWTGTWENLGVPSGSTVTAVNLDFDWSCVTYTSGAASTVGPSELRDSGGTLTGTFATSSAYSSTTTFATKTGTNITGLSEASSTTRKLRLNGVPKTGNSTSAVNTLLLDWVVVTVTYSAGGGPAFIARTPLVVGQAVNRAAVI